MDIKSQVAPKGLEFKANEFIISDKYATILTVISYPRYINPGFLSLYSGKDSFFSRKCRSNRERSAASRYLLFGKRR